MHILLVCSSGGHLHELFSLQEYWSEFSRSWVTFDGKATTSLLEGEHIITAYHPTTRNIKNLFRNLWLAIRVLRKMRPDIIVSTGSGLAIPFFYAAKLYGVQTVYIESVARTGTLSLSGRVVYPVASHFLVQWPELAAALPKAEFKGRVL